jgi:hypothetical protein
MKHLNIDQEDERVKQFVRTLPLEPDGVDLALEGRVICTVVKPAQFTALEKQALIERGRELVRRARHGNKDVPVKVIEREVQQAVDEVRHRKRQQ